MLGCLLEKQRTVPASYPLTLNALRTACNQLNSRDPVVDYDDATVEAAGKRLKQRGLLRIVWSDRGPRTLKYHQLLDEALGLQPDERALVTLLLLRGAQAPGELKTRAERLHSFADREQVEAVLHRMASLGTPLVVQLPRRPGQQDRRWIHLLGPVPQVELAPQTAVDRESVLADGAAARDQRVVTSYDALAEGSALEHPDQHDRVPFERWLLERLVGLAGGRPVLDAGCGTGHIAHVLQQAGADVTGIDLSPGMVARARALFPELAVEVGDLRSVLRPPAAHGWGAVVAWFSLVHLAESELADAVAGLAHVLDDDGWLGLAVLLGDEVRHVSERSGRPVDLDLVLHRREALLDAVRRAGLVDVECYQRAPTAGEDDADRCYVVARKP